MVYHSKFVKMSDGVEALVQGFLHEKLPGVDEDLLNYVVGKC